MMNAQQRNRSLIIARKFCRKHWKHRHQWRIKRMRSNKRLKNNWVDYDFVIGWFMARNKIGFR